MSEILLYSACAVFIYMNLLFVLAQYIQDNSIADIGWGIGFILIAGISLWKSGSVNTESILVSAVVILWGMRLASFIFLRNRKKGEDYRYKKWRKEWGGNVIWRAYLQVFMLQGTIMWLVALPVMITIANPSHQIGMAEIAGVALWVIGFFFEVTGDYQMQVFKSNPANNGRIMKSGLWRYTRHPNYFGEAVMWWGIFIISANNGHLFLSLVSPMLLTFLLLQVSGVALLEKKYTDNPEYQEYISSTRAFIPLPPKK